MHPWHHNTGDSINVDQYSIDSIDYHPMPCPPHPERWCPPASPALLAPSVHGNTYAMVDQREASRVPVIVGKRYVVCAQGMYTRVVLSINILRDRHPFRTIHQHPGGHARKGLSCGNWRCVHEHYYISTIWQHFFSSILQGGGALFQSLHRPRVFIRGILVVYIQIHTHIYTIPYYTILYYTIHTILYNTNIYMCVCLCLCVCVCVNTCEYGVAHDVCMVSTSYPTPPTFQLLIIPSPPQVKLTILLAAIAVPLNTIFGVVAALQLTRNDFPGKAFVLTLLDLPFSISPIVTGLMLVLLYGRNGVLAPYLDSLGLQVVFAFPGMALATLFVTMPFVVRELMPILEVGGGFCIPCCCCYCCCCCCCCCCWYCCCMPCCCVQCMSVNSHATCVMSTAKHSLNPHTGTRHR